MCYFLYWLIQLPFLLVSPHKIRWLFIVKVSVRPPQPPIIHFAYVALDTGHNSSSYLDRNDDLVVYSGSLV
jgi:cytosine/uracil/thiamine/allantoin permease